MTWNEDRVALHECPSVFELNLDTIKLSLKDNSVQFTILEADIITWPNSFRQVCVVHLDAVMGACPSIVLVRPYCNDLTHKELDALCGFCALAASDLTTSHVKNHCTSLIWAQLSCLEELANHACIFLCNYSNQVNNPKSVTVSQNLSD